jgi:hypothetical protein
VAKHADRARSFNGSPVIVCGVVCKPSPHFGAFHGVLLFTSVRNSAGGIRRSIHIGTELMHSDLLRLVLGRLIR